MDMIMYNWTIWTIWSRLEQRDYNIILYYIVISLVWNQGFHRADPAPLFIIFNRKKSVFLICGKTSEVPINELNIFYMQVRLLNVAETETCVQEIIFSLLVQILKSLQTLGTQLQILNSQLQTVWVIQNQTLRKCPPP